MKVHFDTDKFSKAFKAHLSYGDSLRKIAVETSVSPATLSRILNGKNADVNTILKVCDWMGTKIHYYIKDSNQFY